MAAEVQNPFDKIMAELAAEQAEKDRKWKEAQVRRAEEQKSEILSPPQYGTRVTPIIEDVYSSLKEEAEEKDSITKLFMLESGLIVPTIPDITRHIGTEWYYGTISDTDREGNLINLELTREDNDRYFIRLHHPNEDALVRLRLSGHLQVGIPDVRGRTAFFADETFIHSNAALQRDRSLRETYAAILHFEQAGRFERQINY